MLTTRARDYQEQSFTKGRFGPCPECWFDRRDSLSRMGHRERRNKGDHKEETQPQPLRPCKSCKSSALSASHSPTRGRLSGSQGLNLWWVKLCWHSCCCWKLPTLEVLLKWRQAPAPVGCCLYLRGLLLNFLVLVLV